MTDWTTARVTPEILAELRRPALIEGHDAAHYPTGVVLPTRTLLALLDAAEERDEIAGRLAHLLCDLTGGRMSKTSYPVPVMAQEIEQYLSECHESDLKDERDALAAAVERVRALHRPVGIYDECACSDEAKAEGHEDVEEVGLTCNRMYTVCAECCRDDVYQTEDCANYHDHKPDEAHHCPTIRALDEEADA